MFLRIYIGLLAAISIALISSYLIFTSVNQFRVNEYNKAIYAGTFQLMREGLKRHQGERRQEWLSIVQQLSGLNLRLYDFAANKLNSTERAKLSNNTFDFERNGNSETYLVRLLIDQNQYLETEIESVSEQQLRVALLLILNELGRSKSESSKATVDSIQAHFSFPLQLKSLDESALDKTQEKRVKNGAIAVILNTNQNQNSTFGIEDSHSVYAMVDKNTDQVLVYGPIPIFVDTPLYLLVVLLVVSILIIGIAAYVMVRKLEIRLRKMSSLVSGFGPQDLSSRLTDAGADAVAQLAGNFNQMAERIERLVEDQKYMSQAISHELRTPIARMKFRLDILETQSENAENSEAFIEKVHGLKRDLSELNTLVDEALFFQQIESLESLISTSMETIVLADCCDEIAQKVQPLAVDKPITIHVRAEIQVQANAVYLRRLLQNLIVNALRHCKSQVMVSYIDSNEHHVVEVEDDGEGITEDLRELLFQPFQRAENSRNKKLGGYGLGLAIVKRVAELHEGNITILDGELGGARFRFEWPKYL